MTEGVLLCHDSCQRGIQCDVVMHDRGVQCDVMIHDRRVYSVVIHD